MSRDYFRVWMKVSGVTFRQLGKAVGIDFTLLNRYQNGEKDLSSQQKQRLEDYIAGCGIDAVEICKNWLEILSNN